MRARRTANYLSAAVAAAVCALSPAALAAPTEPLGHAGRWITDADGRIVVLHGVNVAPSGFEVPIETPARAGFRRADARFLAREGFNSVRLALFYAAVEPAPGRYDGAYLDAYERTQALLADEGLFTLLDMHQDQYAHEFRGRGFPAWAVLDGGLPNTGQGFPLGYLSNPALWRAYDNFFANAPGPGGVGLGDRFAAAWRQVARRFRSKPRLVGYDIFNEPWPGSAFPLCTSTEGCPPGGFDQTRLTGFSRRTIAAIRQADRRHLAFYEPNLEFDFGARTGHGQVDDPNVGFSFHNYCLGAAPGLPHVPDPIGACRAQGEGRVFRNAEEHTRRTGAALLLTEFGDVADPVVHERLAELADEHMVGWTVWGWFRAGGQIKKDPAKPPTPGNVHGPVLDVLLRPYPQTVAGTPLGWRFDRGRREFRLDYSTARAGGGGRFEAGALSEIVVPRRQYPRGYRVELAGARLASAANARALVLRAAAGASRVGVRVLPGSAVSCADRRRPKSRLLRRRTRLGSRRIVVRGRAVDHGCRGSANLHPTFGSVKRVRVALARRADGRCRYLRRSGRLSRPRRCGRRLWLRARGTRRFRLRMRTQLPPGRYRVISRAVDSRSNPELRRTRRNSIRERAR